MATVNSEGSTQTSVATSVASEKVIKAKETEGISAQDQTAIENMDWGEFDELENIPEKTKKVNTPTRNIDKQSNINTSELIRHLPKRSLSNGSLGRSARNAKKDQNPFSSENLDWSGPSNSSHSSKPDKQASSEQNNSDKKVDKSKVSDVNPFSRESPAAKKAKIVFGRCYDVTFHPDMLDLGRVLAPLSDAESDMDDR